MFFGVNARDTPADQRAEHQFQPPALERQSRGWINQDEHGRAAKFFWPLLIWIRLQNKLRQVMDGKAP